MALITPIQTHSSHSTTAALTMTLAFPGDVTAGSVILVIAGAKKVAGTSDIYPVCTDSQGNPYTLILNDTNNQQRWRTVATSSGPLSVTVESDTSIGNQFFAMGLAEIPSGSYVFDVSDYMFTASSTPTSNEFYVNVDGAALFGFLMTGALGPPVSITENGAWTLIGESVNDSYLPYSFIWRNADIGTYYASWTLGATPFVYVSGIVVEGVPDPPPPSRRHLLLGQDHTITGDDLLAVGVGNTIEGDVSQSHGAGSTVEADHTVHFNLTAAPNTVTTNRTFQVDADIINLNGTVEVNGTPISAPALDDLTDVVITGLTTGDVLKYDGADWVNDAAGGGSGDVVGPASAVDDNVATFDGATGKLIQDGGYTIAGIIAAASGGTSEWTTIVTKATDETVSSNTTIQSDDELFFAVAANERWVFEFNILVIPNVGGMKVGLKFPTTPTAILYNAIRVVTLAFPIVGGPFTADAVGGGSLGSTSTTLDWYRLYGLVHNAGNAGTVRLWWAQNSSSGTGAIVKAGSYVSARKVS